MPTLASPRTRSRMSGRRSQWASRARRHGDPRPVLRSRRAADRERPAPRSLAAFRAPLCRRGSAAASACSTKGRCRRRRSSSSPQSIGSPAFGCYFDTANLVFRGLDPPTEIRRLGRSSAHPHQGRARAKGRRPSRPWPRRLRRMRPRARRHRLRRDGSSSRRRPGPPPLAARDLSFVRSVLGTVEAGYGPWPAVRRAGRRSPGRIAAARSRRRACQRSLRRCRPRYGARRSRATRRLLARLESAARRARGLPANLVARDDADPRGGHCTRGTLPRGRARPRHLGGVDGNRHAGFPKRPAPDCATGQARRPGRRSATPSSDCFHSPSERDVVLALEGSSDTVLKTPSQRDPPARAFPLAEPPGRRRPIQLPQPAPLACPRASQPRVPRAVRGSFRARAPRRRRGVERQPVAARVRVRRVRPASVPRLPPRTAPRPAARLRAASPIADVPAAVARAQALVDAG